jgi:hypothetical protein
MQGLAGIILTSLAKFAFCFPRVDSHFLPEPVGFPTGTRDRAFLGESFRRTGADATSFFRVRRVD